MAKNSIRNTRFQFQHTMTQFFIRLCAVPLAFLSKLARFMQIDSRSWSASSNVEPNNAGQHWWKHDLSIWTADFGLLGDGERGWRTSRGHVEFTTIKKETTIRKLQVSRITINCREIGLGSEEAGTLNTIKLFWNGYIKSNYSCGEVTHDDYDNAPPCSCSKWIG